MQKYFGKLRRCVRKFIRNVGFQRKIAPDPYDIIKHNEIDLVIDVGANDGGYGRDLRDRGYRGLIISFEPNSAVFERLRNNIEKDKYWKAYQYAVGDFDGSVNLNIARNDVMSSIKGLTSFGENTGGAKISTELVNIVRLDSFLRESGHINNCPTILLKIDTQGFEMEVVNGVGNLLNQITAIQAEKPLIHTYADEVDWLYFLDYMRAKKFEVATVNCNSAIPGQVRELDIIFINVNEKHHF